MSRFKHDLVLRVVKIMNVIMITLPFFACWCLYYADRIASPFYAKGDMLMVAIYFGLYIFIGRVYGGFLMSTQRISEIIYGQLLAAAVCDGIMYLVIWLLSKNLLNIFPGLLAFAAQVLLATIWAFAAHKWYFKTFPPRPTAIIYDEHREMQKLICAYGLAKKYDVQKMASAQECISDLEMLVGMKTVFMSGVHSHDRNIILKYCVAQGIEALVLPRIGDIIMSGARSRHMFHFPVLQVGRYMAQPEYLFTKRAMDMLISGVALVLASPIMLITAIAIRSYDHGPVFYRQVRLGKDGLLFNLPKFRSMRVDAEQDGVARLSTGDSDERVTPVGKFIRKCRIDELPQLALVWSGKLSLVGPRPERPEIAAQYCVSMPEFSLRLQAKAGLTGYAQVYGKYNTTPYDKLQMDLMYIAHPSIIEDLKILMATVKILFMPESTEGVEEGMITATDENAQSNVEQKMAIR